MSSLPPAIFLMGPTAAGKTDLAMALADALPCELISVDSALIYRGMDIGTAKPSRELLARYPHRLIDIRDPAESYSAAEFRADALAAMAEATGIDFTPTIAPRRPGDPARIVATGELAARDLGWEMRHSLAEMVRSAWAARRSAG